MADQKIPDPAQAKVNGDSVLPTAAPGHAAKADSEVKKPSSFSRLWAKTGLDMGTVITMCKAALAPTIAIAIYQSDEVASIYTTLGYLVAIATILGFPIMPRAKFVQTMIFNIVAICIGAAVDLLAIWTVVQARKHTTPPDGSPLAYNSSASAVSAIWLFFQVYLVNALRTARPQLQFPGILYSIFTIVAMTYAPIFPTMATGISLVKKLLEAFLSGFAIASAVSFFFVPVNCRTVVFADMTGLLQSLRAELRAQIAYTESLEHVDMFLGGDTSAKDDDKHKKKKSRRVDSDEGPPTTPEVKALRGAVDATRGLHGKLATDLVFGKREIAYGKLGPDDLSELLVLLRNIFWPLQGMSSLMDIFQNISDTDQWKHAAFAQNNEEDIVTAWQNIMKRLHEPFAEIGAAVDQGLAHALLRLELERPPKVEQDQEAKGEKIDPGDEKFADWVEEKIDTFDKSRKVTIGAWCQEMGISQPPGSVNANYDWPAPPTGKLSDESGRDYRQLFVILYMEYLLGATAKATLELMRFADSKHADGTMRKKRLIAPGYRRLSKWIRTLLHRNDASHHDDDAVMSGMEADRADFGEAYGKRKDPEHLPPKNWREGLGNKLRAIGTLLRSPFSMFGFRAACATMSVAIVAYLQDTQLFFSDQRLLWSLIMIAISMTRTSGQSAFLFLLRVFGTFVAMVASFVIWYIVDGKTPGIIVFLFVWIASCFYVVIKKPKFVVVGIISAVTVILILGYELQVRKIGVALATSNSQPYYPIYELAPYRLACVAGGLAVAFFWTMFPFPITDHSEIRRELGSTMYLLAHFYAIVHETVKSKIRGDEGDRKVKGSPAHRMEKVRVKTASQIMLLLGQLQASTQFSKWEISMGGKFPTKTYQTLIDCSQRIFQYSALLSYASKAFEHSSGDESQWQKDFRTLQEQVATTSHDITSRLCLLSSSVINGTPLPPYLQPLEPFRLANKLLGIDSDILNTRHVAEHGYAAFAVMQIASRSIITDLDLLTDEVRSLVGELDFSFHVVPAPADGSSANSAASGDDAKGKRE